MTDKLDLEAEVVKRGLPVGSKPLPDFADYWFFDNPETGMRDIYEPYTSPQGTHYGWRRYFKVEE